jgi:hypothetical protein
MSVRKLRMYTQLVEALKSYLVVRLFFKTKCSFVWEKLINAIDKNVQFHCFKLRSIEVCRELDGASFERKIKVPSFIGAEKYAEQKVCKHYGTPGILL